MAQNEISHRLAPAGEPDWLTLGQAAKYLGVAQSTIRKWSDQGRVPAFYTPGGHRRYKRGDLDRFLERSGPSSAGGGGGPVVLIVDDDERLREYVRVNLEMEGYTVREAGGAEEGLRVLEESTPDLVLLDVMMPGVDGWEMLQPRPGAARSRGHSGDHVQRKGRRGRRGSGQARRAGLHRQAVQPAGADRPDQAAPPGLIRADRHLERWVVHHRVGWLNWLFVDLSRIGTEGLVFVVVALFLAVLWRRPWLFVAVLAADRPRGRDLVRPA